MLKSMTGFGRATEQINGLDVTVEIKSVNHRYFEFSCRVPRVYQFLEEKLKSFCQQKISRGKVEIGVFIEQTDGNSQSVEINHDYAAAYIGALRELSKKYKIKADIKASDFIGNSDMFKIRRNELPDELVGEAVLTVAEKAVESFMEMRTVEGERLKEDICTRADDILSKVALVEEQTPQTVKAYRERLEQRIRDLLADARVDEQRLIAETAIFADKVAVDEETVRLKSHIAQLKALVEQEEPVGKKLDFIVQEMNREANTIGSKAQDIEIAHTVVDIKSEIEKIREQIQNIE